MIVVGTDSYASVQEMEDYVLARFLPEPLAGAWEERTTDGMERALVTATTRIDALSFVGQKADPLQELQFPRRYPVWDGDEPGVLVESQILPNVKRACMEEALATLAGVEESNRVKLQREGVTSAKLGNTTETFSGAGALRPALLSEAAIGYLKPYARSGAGLA